MARTEPLPDEMEAVKTIQYLRERGAKSAIILLPNYKVRRLGRVYRRLGSQSEIEVTVSRQNRINRSMASSTWSRSRFQIPGRLRAEQHSLHARLRRSCSNGMSGDASARDDATEARSSSVSRSSSRGA